MPSYLCEDTLTGPIWRMPMTTQITNDIAAPSPALDGFAPFTSRLAILPSPLYSFPP